MKTSAVNVAGKEANMEHAIEGDTTENMGKIPADLPLVSVIIPVKNSVRTLRACLESCRNQTYPNVEIVVVDNKSSDGTVAVARELADVVCDQQPERSAQRNRGFDESSGEIVFFVDSDMVLEPGVVAEAAKLIVDGVSSAVVVPEKSFGDGFFVSCRVIEKELYVGESSVEAPRVFTRKVFSDAGRWDESLTAAEDWDLADRVRKLPGVTVGRNVNSWIWHDEGHISLKDTYRKKQYYGRWVQEYLTRKKNAEGEGEGVSHLSRVGVLKKIPGVAVQHPVKTVGLVTLKMVEGAGLWKGMRKNRKAV